MTKISCTFVDCEFNSYGEKGVCSKNEIQLGGYENPKEKNLKTKPICVNFVQKYIEEEK